MDSTLGVELGGLDLRRLTDEGWTALAGALEQHAVVVVRGQELSEDDHVALARRFGPIQPVLERAQCPGHPEVCRLSNLEVDGREGQAETEEATSYAFYKGNKYWHSDASFRAQPAMVSILTALVAPASGGETEFADMRAAFDALPAPERERLTGLSVVHSFAYSQTLANDGVNPMTPEEERALPPVAHPLVRMHPATGRPSLFIGRHASHIEGMEVASGRRLLADLLEQACSAPRIYRHEWEVGDVVFWDNRCTLHRGRIWDFAEARVMHRVIVEGDTPRAYSPISSVRSA